MRSPVIQSFSGCVLESFIKHIFISKRQCIFNAYRLSTVETLSYENDWRMVNKVLMQCQIRYNSDIQTESSSLSSWSSEETVHVIFYHHFLRLSRVTCLLPTLCKPYLTLWAIEPNKLQLDLTMSHYGHLLKIRLDSAQHGSAITF